MINSLTHWFTTGTERTTSNERAIQSAIKIKSSADTMEICVHGIIIYCAKSSINGQRRSLDC